MEKVMEKIKHLVDEISSVNEETKIGQGTDSEEIKLKLSNAGIPSNKFVLDLLSWANGIESLDAFMHLMDVDSIIGVYCVWKEVIAYTADCEEPFDIPETWIPLIDVNGDIQYGIDTSDNSVFMVDMEGDISKIICPDYHLMIDAISKAIHNKVFTFNNEHGCFDNDNNRWPEIASEFNIKIIDYNDSDENYEASDSQNGIENSDVQKKDKEDYYKSDLRTPMLLLALLQMAGMILIPVAIVLAFFSWKIAIIIGVIGVLMFLKFGDLFIVKRHLWAKFSGNKKINSKIIYGEIENPETAGKFKFVAEDMGGLFREGEDIVLGSMNGEVRCKVSEFEYKVVNKSALVNYIIVKFDSNEFAFFPIWDGAVIDLPASPEIPLWGANIIKQLISKNNNAIQTQDNISYPISKESEVDWDELKHSLELKTSNLKRPAVRLYKTDIERKSKFGGKPLVEPKDFIWPLSNGKPMTFLAQLDLSEISNVYQYEWLGNEGLLLFFYDINEMPWGFDPNDRGMWKVLFQSNPYEFAEFPLEYDKEYQIKESFIQPKLVDILPSFDEPSIEKLNLSDDEVELYFDMIEETQETSHQVGGFPSPIQGNHMELESQLASNGVNVGGPDGYQSDEAKQLKSGAKDWKLLFQFDTDDELEVMWGDCGMIYFWVQENKAKKNQFDNSWLILQCS
jgi:uncharacterized protein YwqG